MQLLKHFMLTVLVALCSITAFAYDFYVDDICYNINDDGTSVEVTYRGYYYWDDVDRYTGAVTIPSSITIGDKTYSVTSIGYSAFYGCSGLTSVTIPNSVTSIGSDAFINCSGLTSVTIPNSVTSIGNSAFYGCSGLASVTIPNSVTNIGEGVFSICSGLTSFTGKFASEDNRSLIVDGVLNSFAPAGLTSYSIPSTVTSIGVLAFYNCSGLTSITIGNSVTSIGDYAFTLCSGLASVTIPYSVTSIGYGAFGTCSGLTLVTIPNSVTSIGNYAFYNCSGLTSVAIGNSVVSIGEYAFSKCSGLTSVTIGNSVTSIERLVFYDTALYNDVGNWDNDVLYIDGCLIDAKTSISGSYIVKDGTRLIADYGFYCCNSLTSVTIPNSVTSIGYRGVANCRSLTEINSLSTTPPSAETFTFEEVSKSDCVVKVPAEAVDAYKAADGWKEFENIVALEEISTYSVACYKGNSSAVNSTKDIGQIKAMTLQENEMVYVDAKIGAELPNNIVKKNGEGNWVAKEIELTDGQAFYNPSDVQAEVINYTRNFTSTNWQALYVPFDVQYEDWADKADVAYINNVHQFDDDEDGRVERTVIEYLYKRSGAISANKPYLIRPKQTGEMTLTSRNATLKATPATGGSVDCSSTTMLYTLTGTYQTVTNMYEKHWYALSDGALRQASHSGVTLAPFRFYLNITDRNGNPVSDIDRPSYVRLMIGGLMIDEETGIEMPDANTGNTDGKVYDLQGRRVERPKHGLYIIGGKKTIIK